MSFIKEMVNNPHPVYERYICSWNFMLQSYEGGIDYTQADVISEKAGGLGVEGFNITVNGKPYESKAEASNLFRHKKELTEDFLKRIQMSYYYNFCAPIIDIYTNHLFKLQIIENWGGIEPTIERRDANIDRKGSSITEFRMEAAELAQLYGHCFVIVDSPRFGGELISEQERINNDLFPYLTIFHPQNVINWALDEYGAPYWVLVREVRDANLDAMSFDPKKLETCNYRLWTREGWALYNEGFEKIDEQMTQIGRVPITCVVNKRSKKVPAFMGVSELADIAFISRDIYNLCSELREMIRNQTFAFLAIQGDPSEFDELSIGTGKALAYKDGTHPPQYVSPDSGPAEVIKDQIDRQVAKIFQLAKLEGGSVREQSAVEQSGVSKAWDFNQTNSALAKKATHLEDAENRIWADFAAWEGREYDGSMEYPKDFNIKDLWADLEEAKKAFELQLGVETEREIKKAIIKKRFQRMPDEDVDRMVEAIPDTAVRQAGGSILNRLRSGTPPQTGGVENVQTN